MATQVQLRRGDTTGHGSFTGVVGEVTVNTTNDSIHVHDGSTTGGFELLRADLNNITGDTDDITEGSSNLYYTNARVDAEIDSYLSAGTGITLAGSGSIAVDTSVIATKSYVDSQITATIDAAPDTLNTLNELAAALGDDANFATTVTNSLALKAPLANPSLTGTPTAPTASTGTDTTQIATTAFVQQEINALKSLLYAYGQS